MTDDVFKKLIVCKFLDLVNYSVFFFLLYLLFIHNLPLVASGKQNKNFAFHLLLLPLVKQGLQNRKSCFFSEWYSQLESTIMLLEIKLNSFNHTEDVQEDIVINLQILGTRLVSL